MGILLLFFALLMQFIWQIIVGEDPMIDSSTEFLPYLLFSSASVYLYPTFYLRRHRQRLAPLLGTLILSGGGVLLWSVAVADALTYEYATPYLEAVRWLGLFTSGYLVVVSFWLLVKR